MANNLYNSTSLLSNSSNLSISNLGKSQYNSPIGPTIKSNGVPYTNPKTKEEALANLNAGSGTVAEKALAAKNLDKYYPTTATNQSTTVLNSDKTGDIMTNETKLTQMEDKGIRTDPKTGISTDASGNAYDPDEGTTELTEADTSDEDKETAKLLKDMQKSLDSSTNSLIKNIQQKFDQRRDEQKEINRVQEKSVQNALLMGGVTGTGSSAQYAPISSQGIVTSVETYGVKQIADLDAQENDLIAEARAAQQSGSYKIMEQKLALAETKRQEKIDAAIELNKEIAKRNNEIREANKQSSRDSAIANLYSQGITDTTTMLDYLNYDDKGKKIGDFTAKEVADTLKNLVPAGLDDLVKTLRQNGAPQDVISNVLSSPDLNTAYKNAGNWGAGGTGIIGEYNLYKAQAEAGGQIPMSFNEYQDVDANRKKSIAAAGIANEYGLDKEQRARVAGLLDDYDKQAKDKKTVLSQSAQIDALSALALSSNKDKGSRAAAQIGTIFSFMKMLDPTSTVREGEYATAQNTAGVTDKIRNAYNKALDGSFLTDTQIKGYVATAKAVAEASKRQLETIDAEFDRRSAIFGIPAGTISQADSTSTSESLIKTGKEAKSAIDTAFDTFSPEVQDMIISSYEQDIDDITIYNQLKERGFIE